MDSSPSLFLWEQESGTHSKMLVLSYYSRQGSHWQGYCNLAGTKISNMYGRRGFSLLSTPSSHNMGFYWHCNVGVSANNANNMANEILNTSYIATLYIGSFQFIIQLQG